MTDTLSTSLPLAEQTAMEDGSRCASACAHSILVVDDSALQRRILAAQLQKLGFAVRQARSAEEALRLCAEHPPDMIISDWMMPGMSGIEFCQQFREMPRERYGYFVLLTSKSESEEIALAFDAGADDFLTKPVQRDELRARLAAGARVLRMETELQSKNAQLSEALGKLQTLYASLDKDLGEARRLQQSLVSERFRSFGTSQVSLLLRPSGHVGGDLVGFVPVGSDRLMLFAIDVAGHGVASALMTARLSGYLMSPLPDRNIALIEDGDGGISILPPARVAAKLNAISHAELATDTYFTMLLAEIDLARGTVRTVQAGHPHPVVLRAGGAVERIGSGGLPIGLIEEAAFEDVTFALGPGDKLLFVSDGITECESAAGDMLGDEGLHDLVRRNARLSGQPFLESLTWDLAEYADGKEVGDDISAALFEFLGPNS